MSRSRRIRWHAKIETCQVCKPAVSKPRLIARKESGVIEVDAATTLRGVPAEAWEYRLGTYSALEWVLERHKERTPKDPTIREKFNTYRFADYKEPVIDLLRRVTTVSVDDDEDHPADAGVGKPRRRTAVTAADREVYALYGLTEEEIETVRPVTRAACLPFRFTALGGNMANKTPKVPKPAGAGRRLKGRSRDAVSAARRRA